MNSEDLIRRSIIIIQEYYRNNLEPYFHSLSEDILWIGPAEQQVLRGRDTIITAFSEETHALRFTMGSIRSLCISPHRGVYEITLLYTIDTHYPDGNTDQHRQRLQYTWRERRVRTADGYDSIWEIVMIHISNAWPYDKRDHIYPIHYENLELPMRTVTPKAQNLIIKAADASIYSIQPHALLYIETIKHTARLCIHTTSDTIVVNGTLPDYEQRYPDLLMRIHASYLINPAHVIRIERFAVTLTDGTRLPVPEKKYTDIKRKILAGTPRLSEMTDNS